MYRRSYVGYLIVHMIVYGLDLFKVCFYHSEYQLSYSGTIYVAYIIMSLLAISLSQWVSVEVYLTQAGHLKCSLDIWRKIFLDLWRDILSTSFLPWFSLKSSSKNTKENHFNCMFVTDKGRNSCYIHVLFDELGEYFCTVGEFRAVFTYCYIRLIMSTQLKHVILNQQKRKW